MPPPFFGRDLLRILNSSSYSVGKFSKSKHKQQCGYKETETENYFHISFFAIDNIFVIELHTFSLLISVEFSESGASTMT